VTGPAFGVPGRTVALFVWGSMLVTLLLFLAVVATLAAPTSHPFTVSPDLLLGVVIATSALGILLAYLLPARISPRLGGVRGEVTALTRLIVGWSICEAVAISPLIGFVMTRDSRLLPVFFADAAALVAYCPTRSRWERLSRSTVASEPRRRMVR
jgi:hypothetical protein